MAFLLNDPTDFHEQSKAGIVLAHRETLRAIDGGVARSSRTPAGEVALVIGGGSGHYPAFAGLVGPGLAHGAVMGNIFASPSARQVYSVAREVEHGAGVLLAFGNYSGDLMNFMRARDLLRADGIAAEIMAVTDDVASSPTERAHERRGIAGDLVVFKAAAAAAERGHTLEQVLAVAMEANDRTRTLGVAFSGSTLPGAPAPLFTVPEGHMALGVGIHGEPGLEELPIQGAREIAERLWSTLAQEAPEVDNSEIVVIVNGLGAVKYEELYLFLGEVHSLVDAAGLRVVDSHAGEFVTSFEMAGVSLTVAWLTPALIDLWLAPTFTPSFRRGQVALGGAEVQIASTPVASVDETGVQGPGVTVLAALERVSGAIGEAEPYLGELDAVAGDGDHGLGMKRGLLGAVTAARRVAYSNGDIRETLTAAADGWEDAAGGTSGAIWGAMLRAVATALPESGVLSRNQVTAALAEAKTAVSLFGAKPGDRTLFDALLGLVDGFTDARGQDDLGEAWALAALRSEEQAQATASMTPKLGRARTHSGKALNSPDAGAVSLALIARTILNTRQEDPS